jgi:hypothetical protein
MSDCKRYDRVFAIYPNTRGFAFVVFEGQLAPVDWGVKTIRGKRKHSRCLRHIEKILARYEPDSVILQDMSPIGTQRASRITKINSAIEELCELSGIPTYAFSRAQVRSAFSYGGVTTKQAIAEAIAKHVPAFERYLPPIRKPWMTEDSRMGLFDAAALAWTFFSVLRADEAVEAREKAIRSARGSLPVSS